MIAVRVIDYNGDLDTLSEINLIGPYESEQARDADIARLSALDGMSGGYVLEPTTWSDGDYVHGPEAVAEVADADAFGEAIYS